LRFIHLCLCQRRKFSTALLPSRRGRQKILNTICFAISGIFFEFGRQGSGWVGDYVPPTGRIYILSLSPKKVSPRKSVCEYSGRRCGFTCMQKNFALASLNDAVMYFGARPANGSIQVDLFEAKLREKERAGGARCHCRCWCALHFSNDCLHYVSIGVPLSAAATPEEYINYPGDEYSERLLWGFWPNRGVGPNCQGLSSSLHTLAKKFGLKCIPLIFCSKAASVKIQNTRFLIKCCYLLQFIKMFPSLVKITP
jgi:hypothetical protein